MPSAPDLISYNDWLTRTNRKKFASDKDKDRTTALTNVDAWIQAYEKQKSPRNLNFLHIALNTWLNGKKLRKDGTYATDRDHSGAVAELKRAVDNAVRLLKPLGWDEAYPGIFIAQDAYRGDAWVPDDFAGETKTALTQIASKPVGEGLLKSIAAACRMDAKKRVVIEYTAGGAKAAPVSDTSDEFRAKIQLPLDMGGETGFVDNVMANRDIVALGGTAALPASTNGSKRGIKNFVGNAGASAVVLYNHKDPGDGRPMFIALAHELVHAYHYVHGACYRGIGDKIESGKDTGIMEEEMRTVGFGKYSDETPSENAIRDEHRVPRRLTYVPNEAWTQVTASIFV